ncbi:MAG TPA: zincin-like metallopeptidase domain-containing protein [Sphingomonadaceae bacterium]|nr:zincin-like metallopeptidase domain-containing protein [Sphingomonadaceae bacterium]
MTRPAQGRGSAADTITQAIITRLEAGTRPWIKPWSGTSISRPLRACGLAYRGINAVWLWMAAEAGGYTSPFWLTYRQAQIDGGHVRKGERGTVAIFYRSWSEEAKDQPGDDRLERTRRVLRSFTVFNACQIDGLSERYFPAPRLMPPASERDQELRRFFSVIPAKLRHLGDEAYYRPVPDDITMPDPGAFIDLGHYYATLAHELAHWTGHGSRLDRRLHARFGSEAYAAEELVAELTAAMIGAELGLPAAHLDHHASYLASWLRLLRADNRAVLTAAARAEEACSLLLRLGGRSVDGAERDVCDPMLAAA